MWTRKYPHALYGVPQGRNQTARRETSGFAEARPEPCKLEAVQTTTNYSVEPSLIAAALSNYPRLNNLYFRSSTKARDNHARYIFEHVTGIRCDALASKSIVADPLRTRRIVADYQSKLEKRIDRVRSLARRTVTQSLKAGLRVEGVRDGEVGAFNILDPDKAGAEFKAWSDRTFMSVLLDSGTTGVVPAAGHFLISINAQTIGVAAVQAFDRAKKAGIAISDELETFVANVRSFEAADIAATRQFGLLRDMSFDAGDQLRDELVKGLKRGSTAEEIAQKIDARLKSINLTRARTIARTEITNAHANATLNSFQISGVPMVEALVEFSLNQHGSAEPCPICIGLAGQQYTIEGARGIIPVHANCQAVPWWQLLSGGAFNKGFRRKYTGELVTFTTVDGNHASVTANHPVLTDQGFVAACDLDPVSHRIARRVNGLVLGVLDPQQEPATAQEIFETLALKSGNVVSEVPITSDDFHGDGFNGDVDIVWPVSDLLAYRVAHAAQRIRHWLLTADMGLPCFHQLCSTAFQFPAFGLVSSGLLSHQQRRATAGSEFSLISDLLGFTYRAQRNALPAQSTHDSAAVTSELFSNRPSAVSSLVTGGGFEFVRFSKRSTHVEDLLVFDFQTQLTVYCASGLVVSNCGWLPVGRKI